MAVVGKMVKGGGDEMNLIPYCKKRQYWHLVILLFPTHTTPTIFLLKPSYICLFGPVLPSSGKNSTNIFSLPQYGGRGVENLVNCPYN